MKRRIFAAMAGVMVLASLLVTPALAYDHKNYAGRPTNNPDGTLSCHGVAYGRVNTNLVLFLPWHCNPSNYPPYPPAGQPKYGNDGTILGYWSSNQEGASSYDLGYVILEPGQVPFVKNEIYRGTQASGNPDHWTITTFFPSSSLSCANFASKMGRSAYQNYQVSENSTWSFNTATMLSMSGCRIQTNLPRHTVPGGAPDSGAPWVYGATTNQPAGVTTDTGIDDELRFFPFYDGFQMIDGYWETHGTFKGAQLCGDSSCTQQP